MKTRGMSLGRSQVIAALKRYMAASRSEATRVAYACDIQEFRKWGGRIPSTPGVVARYLVEHAGRLACSTLSRRLAAINHAHREKRLESPTRSELVRATIAGIRRT